MTSVLVCQHGFSDIDCTCWRSGGTVTQQWLVGMFLNSDCFLASHFPNKNDLTLSTSLSSWPQLQSGADSAMGQLPCSSSARTMSTDHAGDIQISRATTQPEQPQNSDSVAWRSLDSAEQPTVICRDREEDVGAGKRKPSSPEGGVRQPTLPPPSGRTERWAQEEELRQASSGTGVGVVPNADGYMIQERHQSEDRSLNGGKSQTKHDCPLLLFQHTKP